jgi:TRAP-type C4-dicarboxylate transport system substrate-binding protein
MINRRNLLTAGTATLVAAPWLKLGAQAPVNLRFHTFMSPSSDLWVNGHVSWMKKVEAESRGRIKFEAFPAMQLGGAPPQLYDQARDGVVDIMWSLPGYTPGRFPRTEVFELPFFTFDGEGTSRAAWEFASTHAKDEFKDVRLLAFHTHSPGLFHTKGKLVRSAADLRGMKIRGATRKGSQLLAAIGATPVGMPLPQISDALSKNVVDGAVLPWQVIPSVRVDELTTFHSGVADGYPGIYNSTQFMAMNPAKYDSLPQDLKDVIDRNSGMAASAFFGKVIQDGDIPVHKRLSQDSKHTLHTMGKAETEDMIRQSAGIYDEWVQDMNKRGFDGAKLLADARALIQKNRKT